MDSYAPLWCRSNYSFLEGASHPDELVEEAARLGLRAIGIADRDGVYGIARAHKAAKTAGIPLVIGATIRVSDNDVRVLDGGAEENLLAVEHGPSSAPRQRGMPPVDAAASEIVLLAQNRAGYANLCGLITAGRGRSPKGSSAVAWQEVADHAEGVIALWGGGQTLVGRTAPGVGKPTAAGTGEGAIASAVATMLRDAFGERLYGMVTRHSAAADGAVEAHTRAWARAFDLPIVAGSEVLYHVRARRELQDVLTCIRHGVPLSGAGRRLRPNAEHDLKSPHAFATLFEDDRAALRATCEIAERCTFSLDEIRYVYPSERMPGGMSSGEWLRQLAYEGAFERYGGPPSDAVVAQLEKELRLIDELEYCGYFLTMKEIVRFCRAEGILCQGRGSAANSVVCFCLGITAVDPVAMGLLFERFLSRERAEPPDIDLDIAHERREEVIQHVYRKYGRQHAAMVANFIRYRAKSAVRDVGKALGVASTALDRLAKLTAHQEMLSDEMMQQAGVDGSSGVMSHLYRLASEILDFPRHLSIHPGGFLLGHAPIHTLVPMENATMPGRTVIQWDKYDVEDLGLFKVDLLGLGALTHLDACFSMLQKHRGVTLDLASIPPDDEDTYDMICEADTVGVFQIESRAQMSMLPRLRPRTFYDLVIEVSIVRPGPIAGDMVHPYLRRRHGLEEVVYPHESLIPVLERTLGVPLFQEQVMRLAIVAADYTPGEADQLRRDMAAWRSRGKMDQHRLRLVERMVAKGIQVEFAERVFEQIQGFGEYGFPESHAASFALISYATSYLRCHYLPEFTCSLLNAQPMGFYAPATLIDDAKRRGVEVRSVDIACSEWDCTIEVIETTGAGQFPHAIRLGVRYLRGVHQADWIRARAARSASPFASVSDVVQRSGLNERALRALAESGALERLSEGRREALWDALGALKERGQTLEVREDGLDRPEFSALDSVDTIAWDYATLSASTAGHPLSALREELSRRGLPDALALSELRDGKRTRYVGLVICRQRPGTAGGVVFMTLEDESGFVNLVVWPKTFERYALVARTATFLGVTGKVQTSDNVVHLIADELWVPSFELRPPERGSRDFH